MRAEDIKDRDSLLAWLKDRPREDSVWIAHRAAMRVLPILGSLRSSINPGVPILELLRKNLTQEVVCRSALGVRLAIHQSMMDSNLLSYDYVAGAAFSSTSASNTNDLTFLPSKFASDAVDSAGIAAADGSALLIRQRGLDAEYKSSVMRKSHSEIWRETQNDAKLILAWPTSSILQELSRTPLWSSGQPDWPLIYLDNKALHWHAAGYFPFWLRWYKAVLAGTPLNWSLLSEIALIPDEVWEKGIGHIAGVIAGIELQHAIAATPNGEDIIANPQTGLLQIVAVTDLPADIATYARRKIIRATEVFGANPENQYAALPDDLAMLRAVVADAEATPVELFDACASASRRLRARIEHGSCPAADTDPLIEDYSTRIRDAGADILANDPQTQNMLTARNAIAGNNAIQEGAADIANLVALIEPLTTGRLTLVLTSDATVSADPKANPEDRKDASIRLSSRVLRIGKILIAGTAVSYAAVIGTKNLLEAIPVILASPYFQAAMQWIFKFMGY